MPGDPKKDLTIVECEKVLKEGSNAQGAPYKIYEVKALDANGNPNSVDLRSFTKLDSGYKSTFYMKPYEKDGKVLNYTLTDTKKASAGARLGPKVDDHEQRLKKLEDDMEWVKKQLKPADTPAERERAAEPSHAERAAARPDSDDIPF